VNDERLLTAIRTVASRPSYCSFKYDGIDAAASGITDSVSLQGRRIEALREQVE